MVHAHWPFSLRSVLRFGFIVACLVVALLPATTSFAQEVSPDFAGQVRPTLPANEQLLGQIQDALPSDDLSIISEQTGLTLDVGEDLAQQLTLALSLAPDDAARSRIEGILIHTQATLSSLRLVQTESSLDSARGRLGQARGEAMEALDELRPFVLGMVTSVATTGK
jgi:hypothetical protein